MNCEWLDSVEKNSIWCYGYIADRTTITARATAHQIVSLRSQDGFVLAIRPVARGAVAGNDRVAVSQRAVLIIPDAAAVALRLVVSNSAIQDGEQPGIARVVDAAAIITRTIAADGGVEQRHGRAATVPETATAAAIGALVLANGAVLQDNTAAGVVAV